MKNRFEGFESHYTVTFTKAFVEERRLTDDKMDIHCYLTESGAFDYGNHSTLVVDTMISGKAKRDTFDTRYAMGIATSPASFKKWTYEWIAEGNDIIDISGIESIEVLPDWGYEGEEPEEPYTGSFREGQIVTHNGHECRITKTWRVDGENGISITPTGDYGFEIDIYEDQL